MSSLVEPLADDDDDARMQPHMRQKLTYHFGICQIKLDERASSGVFRGAVAQKL